MKEVKILYDSPFLQLRSIEDQEKGIKPYYYKHVKLYDGKVIAILPFRYSNYPLTFNKEFLLIKEMRPAWDIERLTYASLTGGIEKGSDQFQTAVKELKEETGYIAEEKDLIELGYCWSAKASDTMVYLFTVDVTDKTPEKIKGDGTGLEAMAEPGWLSENDLQFVTDPLVFTMYSKLKFK